MPELFYNHTKLRVISVSTFISFWDTEYGAVTVGAAEHPHVEMSNYSMNHIKGALSHELGHVLDKYYSAKISSGKRISNEQDIIDLVNDCSVSADACGVLWTHGTDDAARKEFVANMFHLYYYSIAPEDARFSPSHPEDMVMSTRLRNMVEKYLRIIRNFPNNL